MPFEFNANQRGQVQKFSTSEIKCAHAEIGQAPTDIQLKFKGIK